ncbi:hypothetical protein E4T38_01137 [Aureobasidium subglaciale]|nr:hypothetical protein E4T38_01137 [Aureobasidium subglaciale]KAI5230368.1 hypothetical protein E4T40_01138 [Aureobasidium subglaciale]KAI5233599.1 hypothetical protein E4T41_01136 [Aureobasidium subglaciale]KAI5266863.1 hypothetical protein E4T46_01136 [Aureobasidium subglaciale]
MEPKNEKWERNTCGIIASSPDMIQITQITSQRLNSEKKPFRAMIHRELSCYFSPYYTAALEGEFSEAQKDTITVNLDHDTAKDLVFWLYSGQIISDISTYLFDLYVFADEKDMLALRRSVMPKIVHCCMGDVRFEEQEDFKRIPKEFY